ncbi:PREDICTED: PHD finger protein 7, partial [Buceros rhinoceros silvestris]|uniref:PHD finger protein 7 n=1 Tax=Buceros rhinoceros silvestris TaxID=175836 RepID=UPI000528FCE7
CKLCRRVEADPDICGRKCEHQGICAHEFCLFFANGLYREDMRDGVPFEHVRRKIKQAKQKNCFVCGKRRASITCRGMGCDRSFHLPCAAEAGCITQYFPQYRSFCWEHRPEQTVEATPEENTVCIICLVPVEEKKTYGTMVCPACKRTWFHRHCIQNQAIQAGHRCFCCPGCHNEYRFRAEMLTMGIRIPRPWQLLLSSSCTAEGTHRRCSALLDSTESWEYDGCAGPTTASSFNLEHAGHSTASWSGPQRRDETL